MSKLKQFLTESEKPKLLNELFIQIKDIHKITPPEREMQLLRFAMSAELDAANLYEAMAKMTNDPDLKEVFLDVAREEKVHFGEFEEMLEAYDEEHEQAEEEGEEEVEDMMGGNKGEKHYQQQ